MMRNAAITMWTPEALSLCAFPRSWRNQCRNRIALAGKPDHPHGRHNTLTRAWFRETLFHALFLKGE